jgi:hypothetical protein
LTPYEVRFWVKAKEIGLRGDLTLRVHPSRHDALAWDARKVTVDRGSYGWQHFELLLNSGNSGNDSAFDVRFIAEGSVNAWIDDVTVRELRAAH